MDMDMDIEVHSLKRYTDILVILERSNGTNLPQRKLLFVGESKEGG